jgi:ornithine cyclodeaminase
MALIGNGSQSEFQAIAFHQMLGIEEFRLYDVDPLATAKLMQNLKSCPDIGNATLVRASSSAEAARGADIITTVTADKRNAVILTPPMVASGVHVNAVGGDCPGKTELHRDIFARADVRVVVEYEPQSRIEGEIQQLPCDYPVIEFQQIVRNAARGLRAPTDVTIFDSVGFALEDYSALRFLHSLRDEFPTLRRCIDLIPDLENPKDLYGGTLGGSGSRSGRGSRGRVRRVA